jgi:hypothetical protein
VLVTPKLQASVTVENGRCTLNWTSQGAARMTISMLLSLYRPIISGDAPLNGTVSFGLGVLLVRLTAQSDGVPDASFDWRPHP